MPGPGIMGGNSPASAALGRRQKARLEGAGEEASTGVDEGQVKLVKSLMTVKELKAALRKAKVEFEGKMNKTALAELYVTEAM